MSALTERGPERSSIYLGLAAGRNGAQADAVELAVSSWELSTHEPMRLILKGDQWNRRADAEAFARIAGGLSTADPDDDQPPPPLAQARDAFRAGMDLGRATPVALFCAAAARLWPRLPPPRRTTLAGVCHPNGVNPLSSL